jgi:hypothetical protein
MTIERPYKNISRIIPLAEGYFPGIQFKVNAPMTEAGDYVIGELLPDGGGREICRVPYQWVQDGEWDRIKQRLSSVADNA